MSLPASPSHPHSHRHDHVDLVDLAIVGAGVAGMAAAEAVKAFAPHRTVRILEQNPAPGGRLKSQRGEFRLIDQTAQFFTARSPEFKTMVHHWEKQGWLKTWFSKPDEMGQQEAAYASPLGMGQLMAHWAMRHEIRCGMQVQQINLLSDRWQLQWAPTVFAAPTQLEAHSIIVTAPWPVIEDWVRPWLQRAALSNETQGALASIRYAPCLVLVVEWNGDSEARASGLEFMPHPDIVCIADQASKGMPGEGSALVFLMTPEFSQAHWHRDENELQSELLETVKPWLGAKLATSPSLATTTHVSLQRWPHARVTQAFGKPFLNCETTIPLYVAGDGFGGARVEGAFMSGWEAGKALAKQWGSPP